MKYPSICLITNILVLFIIFSSADNSSGPDAKEDNSKVIITFNDGEKPPEDLNNTTPLPGDITFTDADGNHLVVKSGSTLKFAIKVKGDEKYKDGRVNKCEFYETANPSNRKQLSDTCMRDESIDDWVWDEGEQKFETNFTITKLPGSKSDGFAIECYAIVCKSVCPPPSCVETDARQKRAAFVSLLMRKIALPINLLLLSGFRGADPVITK